MRIVNLIEDTKGESGCSFEHGLSFYAETRKHRLLVDLGPSEAALSNARVKGIDLKTVDTVILSHGHYDHSGGIIPFTKINDKALIYMQASAGGDYYADDGEDASPRFRYIGIDKDIASLPQIRSLSGDTVIDDELELMTIGSRRRDLPSSNKRLLIKTGNGFIRDTFAHEQFAVIRQDDMTVLLSGCAHNGILNILDAFTDRYGKAPDIVVSGFHLMKRSAYTGGEIKEIEDIARELKRYPTRFITCHCTGVEAYKIMKSILGDALRYVHSGEEITISY
ncbi:MAG: MBL fold metallo-hydrolase [Clostridiales bacterium]|nr:MBL fold metallo-hydrolase [Clostridiales bacterium]